MKMHTRGSSRSRPVWPQLALVIVALLAVACASAGRQAARSAAAGDWDTAVEYYQRALQDDPDRPEYRISLARARINASRAHISAGRAFEEQQELSAALREYRVAAGYDPSNSEVAARAGRLDRTIRERIDAARPPPPIEAMREQARRETAPPLLNPASRDPLVLDFRETSLQDLIDFIGDATGISVTYDEQFQDREVTIRIDGLTLEETLNHVLSINQSFYKVLNPRAIIVVPETPQKRAQYEEQVIRTFYVSHADVQELSQLLSQIVRVPQMAVQPAVIPNTLANTITVRATTAVAAIIEQVIAANDKPLAEVIIDVEILEVNRARVKAYGLNLSDYSLGVVFSPEVLPTGDSASLFNLNTISRGVSTADFYLGVPAAVVRFLETDSRTRLVAKPQLRGQEGQTMTLNLGEDFPVPQTAFTAIAAGGAAVNPLTSFVYRPVGVTLEMTPRVTFENEIILDLLVENSTLGANIEVAGTSLPSFGSRRVQTRLRLRDGESNLLAGLLKEEDRRELRGFPGISRVPLLRRLFGDTDEAIRQTDIVMLLTPRIVRGHELTQRDLSPIHIGTQTNFGLTGPPPLIAPQPDAGVPDTPEPDAAAGAAAESPTSPLPLTPVPTPSVGTADTPGVPMPSADTSDAEIVPDVPDADTVPLEPTPPVEPEPALPPPARPELSAAAQVVVTSPGAQFRVGGGPYTVPVSIAGVSQLSTISLTLFFDPNVVRVRTVQEGSFMRQGGVQVTFTQQVDRAAGRVDITATRLNDATGAAGTGLLAAVQFDVVGVGSVTLSTSGTAMTPGGAPIALQFTPVTVTAQ
ncbi:MAG: hypothetical protein IH939_07805 [Acidobacteria bacterium]|nr:hypothetical protein [Acidobacteriota bacterium]